MSDTHTTRCVVCDTTTEEPLEAHLRRLHPDETFQIRVDPRLGLAVIERRLSDP